MPIPIPFTDRYLSIRFRLQKKRDAIKEIPTPACPVAEDADAPLVKQNTLHFDLGKITAICKATAKDAPVLKFKHSGSLGDTVYSLPTCLAIARGRPIEFYLDIHNQLFPHPLHGTPVYEKAFRMLKPLFDAQENLTLHEYTGQEDCIDLDLFRHPSLDVVHSPSPITSWYQLIYPVSIHPENAWLSAPKDPQYADAIVVARSARYHNPNIDYSALRNAKRVLFLGLPTEYEAIKLPNAEHIEVTDFLHAATIINSAKAYVGNQSFMFSLAEGLKVKRILERNPDQPDVCPLGGEAYMAHYKELFDYLVSRL